MKQKKSFSKFIIIIMIINFAMITFSSAGTVPKMPVPADGVYQQFFKHPIASVVSADLNGDGVLEFVSRSQHDANYGGSIYIEARLHGSSSLLWEKNTQVKNAGKNNPLDLPIIAWDFNGDGKWEVYYHYQQNSQWRHTIVNGLTGEALADAPVPSSNHWTNTKVMGAVSTRGGIERIVLVEDGMRGGLIWMFEAWNGNDFSLNQSWQYNGDDISSHDMIRTVDIDLDGSDDEILAGGVVLNSDGSVRYLVKDKINTNSFGAGDQILLGFYSSTRPDDLVMILGDDRNNTAYVAALYAKNGEKIWSYNMKNEISGWRHWHTGWIRQTPDGAKLLVEDRDDEHWAYINVDTGDMQKGYGWVNSPQCSNGQPMKWDDDDYDDCTGAHGAGARVDVGGTGSEEVITHRSNSNPKELKVVFNTNSSPAFPSRLENLHYRKDVALLGSGYAPFWLGALGIGPTEADIIPPVISNVTSVVNGTRATISWSTNERADSQVEYGTSSNYGLSSTPDPILLTEHSVTIDNLQANTLYHYRIHSKDGASNVGEPVDYTLITGDILPVEILLEDHFNNATLTNNWRLGSNSANQASINNKQLLLSTQNNQYESSWVVSKERFVPKNSTVTVKVVQPNGDGNIGLSPTYTLASTNGFYREDNFYRYYVYRSGSSGPYELYAQWRRNGIIGEVNITGSLNITGSIFIRLRYDETHIHYEASFDGNNWTTQYSEVFNVSGKTINDSFYYEISAYKTWISGELIVDDFSIIRENAVTDLTPPIISSVSASNLTETTAAISWQTNEPANSQVEYGHDTNYGSFSSLNTGLSSSHGVTLSGLIPNTTYHYRVISEDGSGNRSISDDAVFSTLTQSPSYIFSDNFDGNILNPDKWNMSANRGNTSSVSNNELRLTSNGYESGRVYTKAPYQPRNTTVTVKVTQANDDGRLGMSPTVTATNHNGIYNESSYYMYYVYRDQASGPYQLYAQWKKNGNDGYTNITNGLIINGTVYLRWKFDHTQIHYQASLNGIDWTNHYSEDFALDSYDIFDSYFYELAAYKTSINGELIVDDFTIDDSITEMET